MMGDRMDGWVGRFGAWSFGRRSGREQGGEISLL